MRCSITLYQFANSRVGSSRKDILWQKMQTICKNYVKTSKNYATKYQFFYFCTSVNGLAMWLKMCCVKIFYGSNDRDASSSKTASNKQAIHNKCAAKRYGRESPACMRVCNSRKVGNINISSCEQQQHHKFQQQQGRKQQQ
jgi:hypothetical protein